MKARGVLRKGRFACAAIALTASHVVGASGAEAQATAGDPAPAFELETVDGELVSLSDYLGEKVVYINFLGNT